MKILDWLFGVDEKSAEDIDVFGDIFDKVYLQYEIRPHGGTKTFTVHRRWVDKDGNYKNGRDYEEVMVEVNNGINHVLIVPEDLAVFKLDGDASWAKGRHIIKEFDSVDEAQKAVVDYKNALKQATEQAIIESNKSKQWERDNPGLVIKE